MRVQEDGATTQLLKTGLYGFDANNGDVRVFKGEALVQDGDKYIKVKGGHEFDLKDTANLKTRKFNKSTYEEGDLYRFSNLRSQYLAEANIDAAGLYVGGAPGWYGAGWYWDPFFTAYTWILGDGIFYSPFGWGFYSPWFVSYAPFYYGRYYPYGYGGHARPYYGDRGYASRPGYAAPHIENGFHAAPSMGTPHSFGVMGGGFHGGSPGR